jgi:hypothetical protein
MPKAKFSSQFPPTQISSPPTISPLHIKSIKTRGHPLPGAKLTCQCGRIVQYRFGPVTVTSRGHYVLVEGIWHFGCDECETVLFEPEVSAELNSSLRALFSKQSSNGNSMHSETFSSFSNGQRK